MLLQQFADEGARHDDALVDIERQAAHVDLVDEVGGRFSGGDAALDHIENLAALVRRDPRGGEWLELVRMQTQHFADDERRLGDRIGGAVGKNQFRRVEAADGIADEIEQREQLARLYRGRATLGRRLRPGFLGHQDRVQRAAASSSWLRASTQWRPAWDSSRFQNGALALR